MTDEQRAALVEFQSVPLDEGYDIFRALPDDLKDLIVLIHDQYRLNKAANRRPSRKSIGQNFRHSIRRISGEVSFFFSYSRCHKLIDLNLQAEIFEWPLQSISNLHYCPSKYFGDSRSVRLHR